MLNKLKANMRDARPGEELTLNITKGDIAKAIEEREQGVPLQQCCPLYQSAIRQHGIIGATFTRHFARIWFKRPDDIIYVLRYVYSSPGGKDTEARDVVLCFDTYGFTTGTKVTLYPPRGVRTLKYVRNKQAIRGKKRKDVKGKSTAKIKSLKATGKYKARGYKAESITIIDGVASDGKGRWGLGQHDSIA